MIMGRALVAAWDDHQWPILFVAVVEQHPGGEHVVVSVRIERPILVPLDRRAIACRLDIHLAAIHAHIWAQKLRHDIGYIGIRNMTPEIWIMIIGLFDPPNPRIVWAVTVFQIVKIIIGADVFRVRNDRVGFRP